VNLAIDIGNTRTKLGVFEEQRLVQVAVWEQWTIVELNNFLTNHSVQNVIYSTVGQLSTEKEHYLKEECQALELTATTPLPFINTYHTPETLGKDRLAAVAGALELHKGINCLVIDAGTCITYDLLTAAGEYVGGNISPGLTMRLRAMHHFTARLPLVERQQPTEKIGKSTVTAMQIGGGWGTILEMQGVIDHFKKKFGTITIVLTGGDTDFFVNSLKSEIFVHQNLVLIGLNKILNYNVQFLE